LAQDLIKRNGPSTRYMSSSTIATQADLNELASILEKSKTGLIIIGSLNPYENHEEVIKFIKLINWTAYFDVSSSLKYQFNLTDNALPTFDHPEVQEALIQNPPETILHIGGRLTSKHYYTFLKQVPAINLVTLSRNIEKEDPSHHTKIRINADINSTLQALSEKLVGIHFTQQKLPLDFKKFTLKKIELIDNGPLAYPLISKIIIDQISNDAILYIGNSTVVRSFDAYFSYQNRKKLTIATNRGVSGIEGFIASSVGFIDGSQKEVYLVLGDVAFIHDLNSLLFLADSKIPLKIILINNNGGGIFTLLPINKEKNVLDYITSPHGLHFENAAKLAGIDYLGVRDQKSLSAQFKELQNSKRHCLLEIFIDNKINKEVYDQLRTIKL